MKSIKRKNCSGNSGPPAGPVIPGSVLYRLMVLLAAGVAKRLNHSTEESKATEAVAAVAPKRRGV
jgi:hypothetical protein